MTHLDTTAMPQHKTIITALLATALSTAPVFANEWTLKRKASHKQDVAVYLSSASKDNVHKFKGVTYISHPKSAIMALILDNQHMCSLVYQCQRSWPVSIGHQQYTYLALRGIWPAKGRDLVIKKVDETDNTLTFTSADGIVEKNKQYVRVISLNNQWTFTEINNNETKVELTTAINPGGSVPSWLVRKVSVNAPLYTLRQIHALLDEPK